MCDENRASAVRFIEAQLKREKRYGKQELRELLDFLYGGPPIPVFRMELLD